jgi:hypothetical protein
MRKVSLFMVLSFATMSLIFVQCKKEEPANQTKPEVLTDAMVTAKIKAFNERLKSATKTDAPMAIDDAVWNIEAALNYNFCRADLPQGNTYEDSLFVEFSVINGMLAFADITSAYQQSVEKLQIMLKKENAHAIVVDVMPLQTSGLFKAKVTFVVGDGVAKKNVTYPNDFGTTDYWRWSWNLGKCDGTCSPDDARSQLAYWLNSGFSYLPGQYFTDVAEVIAGIDPYSNTFKNTNDQTPNDNYLDYKIFINSRQGINGNGNTINLPNFLDNYDPGACISPDEMNFYKWSMRDIAVNYSTNGGIRPLGKSIVNYSITGFCQFYYINGVDVLYWTSHRMHVNYGILHTGQQG